ncbi:MAG: flagellar assembly protein FliW [Spirochaetes bacterium]|nr:MAG: flagellar assembly protein FliW [Spirochaetota bacterium]
MKIKTKAYGTVEVDERQEIYFPYGILGFESFKHFVLMDAREKPFYWLQSVDVPEIAFILINPYLFRPDYSLDVPGEELEDIGITDSEDSLVFAIVTIPENQSKMTANLQGPIVINKKSRTGKQMISDNPRWKVRHLILEELAAVRNEVC